MAGGSACLSPPSQVSQAPQCNKGSVHGPPSPPACVLTRRHPCPPLCWGEGRLWDQCSRLAPAL